jgi:hypothetical protein
VSENGAEAAYSFVRILHLKLIYTEQLRYSLMLPGFGQKSPQQRGEATVMSLCVLFYAAAKEVSRIRVRVV